MSRYVNLLFLNLIIVVSFTAIFHVYFTRDFKVKEFGYAHFFYLMIKREALSKGPCTQNLGKLIKPIENLSKSSWKF
jgi:hypothetical protein